MCFLLTVKGELEQTKKSVNAVTTRLLRSRGNEVGTKELLHGGVKRSSRAVAGISSALPAGSSSSTVTLRSTMSLRSSKIPTPQQVSTRSSTKPHSNPAVQSTTPVKSTAQEMHAAVTKSPSAKSPASTVDVQQSSRTRMLRAGEDGKKGQKSQNLSDATSASRMSTRSSSVTSLGPVKSNVRTTSTLPWVPARTYGRKHVVDKSQTPENLWSVATGRNLSTAADAGSGPEKHGTRREADKMPVSLRSDTSSALSSDEESKLRVGLRHRSPQKCHSVAVQADIQSSADLSHQLSHSSLQSTASSVTSSVSPSRCRSNTVMESCGSRKTALIAASAASQYDTCFETASSQLQNSEEIDDKELDRLARLAHGSPQSTVIHSSTDESATNLTAASVEQQRTHASTVSRDKPSTVHTQQTVSVANDRSDESLDSGDGGPVKKRRTEIDRTEETEQSPKRSRAPRQLAGYKKLVKSASGSNSVAAVSPQHHSMSKRSARDVSSPGVNSSSVTPVVGASGGIAPRTTQRHNVSKQQSPGSGKN